MAFYPNNSHSSWSTFQPSRNPAASYNSQPRWSNQRGPSWKQQGAEAKPEIPPLPLGQLLMTINKADLSSTTDTSDLPPAITGCEYVASYSWLDKTSTILVPGKPPAWTPLGKPQQLKEDQGQYFRDPNAARFPKHPVEPAVQALFELKPAYPTAEVDVFACGSTIGNLLRFARGLDKSFRFTLEVIGTTVFFIRREGSPTEIIPDVRGFGHTFPEAYTTWEADVKGSESHQRLIKYNFGGVECLVRFGSDGYFSELDSSSAKITTPKKASNPTSLTDAFSSASLGGTTLSKSENLKVKSAGNEIPQSAVFDLKTRSARKAAENDMSDIYPRLWITQVPNLILAYHKRGLFEDIRKLDVRRELDNWAEQNANGIRRLHALMRRIIEFARNSTSSKLEVYRADVNHLEIRKQAGDGCDALPPDLKTKWEDCFEASERKPTGTGESTEESFEECGFFDDSDDDDDKDFTACSLDCGYCGHCTY